MDLERRTGFAAPGSARAAERGRFAAADRALGAACGRDRRTGPSLPVETESTLPHDCTPA